MLWRKMHIDQLWKSIPRILRCSTSCDPYFGGDLHDTTKRWSWPSAASTSMADAWSWYHLGYLYHYNLRRFPEALKAYRRALDIDPHYTKVWESLGPLLAWETDDLAGAEEAF